MYPDGVYTNLDYRNTFINALVRTTEVGENCQDTRWWTYKASYVRTYPLDKDGFPWNVPVDKRGIIRQCTQTDFLHIARYKLDKDGDELLRGWMHLRVEQKSGGPTGSNWYSTVFGVLNGAVAIFGAVPTFGAAAAVAGGIFGIVAAACGKF